MPGSDKPLFQFTAKQNEALDLLAGPARHILLRGGSRSGKTFAICYAILARAAKAPGSTHAIFRHRFNHIKASIISDTMPSVNALCCPLVKLHLNRSDWYHELANGSRIYYGGLDDKARTEKILGQEHSSIYLNECSQISYSARNMSMTRLAQRSTIVMPGREQDGKYLPLKAYYDCNPPTTGHWTYGLFMEGIEPTGRSKLSDPSAYVTMRMNPADNLANLPAEYLETLDALPERERKRFLFGEFLPQVVGALWTLDSIQREKVPADEAERDALLARMRTVVIGVDPSGCSGPEDTRSDEIGIIVAGKDQAGNCYVLEDASGHYSPDSWGRIVVELYDKWQADRVIGESNYGGEMVRSTIQVHRRSLPCKLVRASRGKHIRAEPVSVLYAQKKVFHVGGFADLEDQMMAFTAAGYQGERSPDRADAMVFALTNLFSKGEISSGEIVGLY